MVIINYGMPRSASTFIWQITYDLINYKYKQYKLKELLDQSCRANFIYDIDDKIDYIVDSIPEDQFYLIKTHGVYTEKVEKYIDEGKVKVICSIRNPYDIGISWLDIQLKEKNSPDNVKRPGFIEIDTFDKVIEVVKRDMLIAEKWLNTRDPLVFRYSEIINNNRRTINRIVEHIGLDTYLFDKVFNFYKTSDNITEYNVGVSGRGKELKETISDHNIKMLFDDFSDNYKLNH